MATQDDLRAVAGKALADDEFRQKLMDDPEAAVKESGFELNDEQMKALKEMDREQFEQGLDDLDKRLTMGCWVHFVPDPLGPIWN
jgi:restriction endonuclease Mrr